MLVIPVVRSSWLVAALRLVNGVALALPPYALVPSVGVLVPVPVVSVAVSEGRDAPFDLAACFAAFSASRFCLDAEGGIVRGVYGVGNECVVCGREGSKESVGGRR